MVPLLYLAQVLLGQLKIFLISTWDITLKYLAFWVDLGFSHPHGPAQGSPGRMEAER